jgi:acyl-CoA synthetase (AMP-forming)/AMP-acid ligase II
VAITGAAPCPVPLKQAITDWWGPVVHELYGASESYGNCHIGPEEAAARPGSVGRALSGTIHVTDEAGVELPGGQTGTIWFEGTTPFRYDGDEHTPRHPKGWITVGDRGHLDADGYLYLSGRRDHLVISGGVNVSPQAAEDVLAVHPAVEDVAVLGEPDPDLGERLVAVVVPHPSQEPGTALAAELVAACRAALSKAETPARVDFVEALPRAENGKLYKSLLQHRYQGDNKG